MLIIIEQLTYDVFKAIPVLRTVTKAFIKPFFFGSYKVKKCSPNLSQGVLISFFFLGEHAPRPPKLAVAYIIMPTAKF